MDTHIVQDTEMQDLAEPMVGYTYKYFLWSYSCFHFCSYQTGSASLLSTPLSHHQRLVRGCKVYTVQVSQLYML
jgi:hypothetical protein